MRWPFTRQRPRRPFRISIGSSTSKPASKKRRRLCRPAARLPLGRRKKTPSQLKSAKQARREPVGPALFVACLPKRRGALLHVVMTGLRVRTEEQEEIGRSLHCRSRCQCGVNGTDRRQSTASVLGWPIALVQYQNRDHLPPDRLHIDVIVNYYVAVIGCGNKDVRNRRLHVTQSNQHRTQVKARSMHGASAGRGAGLRTLRVHARFGLECFW